MSRPRGGQTTRVLFVIDSLTPGGTETSTVALLAPLRELGVRAEIAVFRTEVEDLRDEAEAAGAVVHVLDGTSLVTRLRRLRALIRGSAPDIVHTALYVADQLGRLAALGTGVPVISSFVNTPYDPGRFNDPNVRRWRLRTAQGLDALTGRLLVRRFHAVSEGVRDANCAALRIPRSRVVVAERGRDVNRLGEPSADRRRAVRHRLGIPEHAPVVLNIGRLDHQKGQLALLEATPLLATSQPDVHVLIAGKDGSASDALRSRLAADPDAASHVRLLGHRTDVGDLLCAADVLVVSSHVEGTAGAAIEAMAMGTPVVATRVAGVQGVLADGHNALLVPTSDPAGLATAAARVLGDRSLAARLADQAGRDFARRFTIEAAADRMATLYRSTLAPPARADRAIGALSPGS